jgi:hypothetical protein
LILEPTPLQKSGVGSFRVNRMTVVPILGPGINWVDLVRVAKDAIGRSPTASIDFHRIKPEKIDSLIAVLAEISNKDSNPRLALENATWELDHCYYTFLVHLTDLELGALLQTIPLRINFVNTKDMQNGFLLCVCSGSIRDWKQVIMQDIVGNSFRAVTTRLFLLEIFNYFKIFGLKNIFPSRPSLENK